jgi:hypothetical protein
MEEKAPQHLNHKHKKKRQRGLEPVKRRSPFWVLAAPNLKKKKFTGAHMYAPLIDLPTE